MNDKLQDRGGNNAADKPGVDAYNSFFGARRAVPLDNVSGDIEIVPTPPPGVVRILDDPGEVPASFGQVVESVAVVTGNAIYQDVAGNEHALENITSAADQIQPTTKLNTTYFPHLISGERLIYRPAAAIAGEGLFLGAWKDTDLNAARADLTEAIQTVAAPPPGKTWAVALSDLAGANPYDDVAVWNFDSVAHGVLFYFNDGTQDILIDDSLTGAAVPAWGAGPPPAAGEGTPSDIAVSGLVIPDGCSLRAQVEEAIVTGPCRVLIPFFELNASKLDPRAPTF